jgi:hypothetical protein
LSSKPERGGVTDLAAILELGPRRGLPPAGAKICQPCGRPATWESAEGRAAGHVHGGDFIGFSAGHAHCANSPFPAHLSRRPYRYCEVCLERIEPRPESRRALSWLCERCAGLIAASEHAAVDVLDELAFRRFVRIGAHRPNRGEGLELPDEVGIAGVSDLPNVPPPEGWLPEGLYPCVVCGGARGEAAFPGPGGEIVRLPSRCLCFGPACTRCRRPRSHLPISNYYEHRTGAWIHVPHFVGFKTICRACEEAGGN